MKPLRPGLNLLALLAFLWLVRGATAAETVAPTFKFDDFLLVPLRFHLLSAKTSPKLATTLSPEEIAQARAAARKLDWVETATGVLQQADALYRAKKPKDARVYYERLAGLPLKTEPVERAKKRAGH